MGDDKLQGLWSAYHAACGEPDPNSDFNRLVWARIENRDTFWSVFGRVGRAAALAGAALCFAAAALNVTPHSGTVHAGYVDSLAAEHAAESTFYADALRTQEVP